MGGGSEAGASCPNSRGCQASGGSHNFATTPDGPDRCSSHLCATPDGRDHCSSHLCTSPDCRDLWDGSLWCPSCSLWRPSYGDDWSWRYLRRRCDRRPHRNQLWNYWQLWQLWRSCPLSTSEASANNLMLSVIDFVYSFDMMAACLESQLCDHIFARIRSDCSSARECSASSRNFAITFLHVSVRIAVRHVNVLPGGGSEVGCL